MPGDSPSYPEDHQRGNYPLFPALGKAGGVAWGLFSHWFLTLLCTGPPNDRPGVCKITDKGQGKEPGPPGPGDFVGPGGDLTQQITSALAVEEKGAGSKNPGPLFSALCPVRLRKMGNARSPAAEKIPFSAAG